MNGTASDAELRKQIRRGIDAYVRRQEDRYGFTYLSVVLGFIANAEERFLHAMEAALLGLLDEDEFWSRPPDELELAFRAIAMMADDARQENKHRFKFEAVAQRIMKYLNTTREETGPGRLRARYAAYNLCIDCGIIFSPKYIDREINLESEFPLLWSNLALRTREGSPTSVMAFLISFEQKHSDVLTVAEFEMRLLEYRSALAGKFNEAMEHLVAAVANKDKQRAFATVLRERYGLEVRGGAATPRDLVAEINERLKRVEGLVAENGALRESLDARNVEIDALRARINAPDNEIEKLFSKIKTLSRKLKTQILQEGLLLAAQTTTEATGSSSQAPEDDPNAPPIRIQNPPVPAALPN